MSDSGPGETNRKRPRDSQQLESMDERMISLTRLLLASAALLSIYIDPAEPDRLVSATYSALVIYVLYSFVLFMTARARTGANDWQVRWAHWIDVLCFTVFIALSSGTHSIFFVFYYFSILIASFRWGFSSGLAVTVSSCLLFSVVGYLAGPPTVEVNRLLLRPIALLVLGYMVSYWGGFEIELRRRLRFLRDVMRLANPRFGIEQTISFAMEQFRNYYDADRCLLVLAGSDPNVYHLRSVSRGVGAARIEHIGPELAEMLLWPSLMEAVLYRSKPRKSLRYNLLTEQVAFVSEVAPSLVSMLDAKRFLSVPVNYRGQLAGRLYVIGGRRDLQPNAVDFIVQAIDQLIPTLDNIRLVDHLASDAAEHEREKIARDIHDSVLQPYIGLQLGLTAVRQKLERGDSDVLQGINALTELTAKGIADLRHYVGEIKTGEVDSNPLLVPALRRFASRFTAATGIKVKVEANDDLGISDRLAAELFQMVTEALSNIRRHTQARSATAILSEKNGNLTLTIENDSDAGATKFHPRSLSERAIALGGELTVDLNGNGRTLVNIQIPL